MSIRVEYLSAEHEPAYTRYVQAHPNAFISHTLPYRDFLVDLLSCQPHYAVALRGNEIVGVMPLMRLEGAFGAVLNSLPYFGSIGGSLTTEADAEKALHTWYSERASGRGVAVATVMANPLTPEAQPVHDLVDHRVAHFTALTGDADVETRILAAIDGSARRNVNKAERCGTRVTIENNAFGLLETLHRRSMEAIGAKVKGPEFFKAIPQHFRPEVDFNLYVARIDNVPAAALLLFYCAKTVDYYVPAAGPEHRAEQPMAAILFRALADAARRGLSQWNWGGSWPSHESLQRFKAKWGGEPRHYRYYTKLNDPSLLHAKPEDLLRSYPGFFVVPFSSLIKI